MRLAINGLLEGYSHILRFTTTWHSSCSHVASRPHITRLQRRKIKSPPRASIVRRHLTQYRPVAAIAHTEAFMSTLRYSRRNRKHVLVRRTLSNRLREQFAFQVAGRRARQGAKQGAELPLFDIYGNRAGETKDC